MASPTNKESMERNALDHVEALLSTLANQLPSLLDEIMSTGSILKQTNLRSSLHSLSTATYDIPSDIAAELRLAAEAAESKQFFSCTQKLKNTSHKLQMLMEEAKLTRRKIDHLAMSSLALEQRQSLQSHCVYLEQAVSFLYALNLGLHDVQLTANALYVHGLKEETQPFQATDDLKQSIARLVSIVSTKHFKSSLTLVGLQ